MFLTECRGPVASCFEPRLDEVFGHHAALVPCIRTDCVAAPPRCSAFRHVRGACESGFSGERDRCLCPQISPTRDARARGCRQRQGGRESGRASVPDSTIFYSERVQRGRWWLIRVHSRELVRFVGWRPVGQPGTGESGGVGPLRPPRSLGAACRAGAPTLQARGLTGVARGACSGTPRSRRNSLSTRPVWERRVRRATWAGEPSATMRPPPSPPSGPRSMT